MDDKVFQQAIDDAFPLEVSLWLADTYEEWKDGDIDDDELYEKLMALLEDGSLSRDETEIVENLIQDGFK